MMSLKEAMLEIAEQMEADAADIKLKHDTALKVFARQIRSACKAAPDAGEGAVINPLLATLGAGALGSGAQNALGVERARQEFKRSSQPGKEEAADTVALVHDGPFKGEYAPVPPGMPVGARTHLAEEVYEMRKDGQFHHVPGKAPEGKKP